MIAGERCQAAVHGGGPVAEAVRIPGVPARHLRLSGAAHPRHARPGPGRPQHAPIHAQRRNQRDRFQGLFYGCVLRVSFLNTVFRMRIRVESGFSQVGGSGAVFRIRIRIRNPDPDPGGQK